MMTDSAASSVRDRVVPDVGLSLRHVPVAVRYTENLAFSPVPLMVIRMLCGFLSMFATKKISLSESLRCVWTIRPSAADPSDYVISIPGRMPLRSFCILTPDFLNLSMTSCDSGDI